MGISINQVFGRVGINTTDAFIDIKRRMPVVEVRSRLPRVRIETQQVQVAIDQKQCFYEVGLKTPDVLARETAGKSQSKGLRAIAAIARRGDTLARVDKNPRAIPMLAKSIMGKRVDYTVAALPKSRPRIHFTGGTDISWDMGDAKLETTKGELYISAARAGVDIYLIQKPHIETEYQGTILDRSI